MKYLKLTISLVTIFILAVLVWYSPILFKGYNSTTQTSSSSVRARNFSDYGIYGTENDLNVILAPELVSEQARESFYGNKLGTILHSFVLKTFKNVNSNQILFINSIILALGLVIFGLTVYFLFNLKTLWLFSLFYIFLPSNWYLAQLLVGYEFSLLFLSLFFLFLYRGIKLNGNLDNSKKNIWIARASLALSGVFITLSAMSREAIFLIIPILFIYLLFSGFKKYILYIFIPVAIILGLFWMPDFITGKNTYLLFFVDEAKEDLMGSDFSYYSHLFPDPYTYHFERESHLEQYSSTAGADTMKTLGISKVLTNMGFKSISFFERLKVATPLFFRHIFRFFSITEIGGPFIFLLLFLGFDNLRRKKKFWFKFFVWWISGSAFLLAYVNLAGRNHLMDFGFAIALGVSLGTITLADLINEKIFDSRYKKIITILIVGIVIYSLVLTGHVMWGQRYDDDTVPLVNSYSKEIKKFGDISPEDVIATSVDASSAYNLNFSTEKSVVVFANNTVKNLISSGKLVEMFDLFKVKYILGYDPELSDEIAKETGAIIIADNTIEPSFSEDEEQKNKSWFLNLVK